MILARSLLYGTNASIGRCSAGVRRFMKRALEQWSSSGSSPGTALCRIEVLSAEERHRLLVEWNATEAAYPADRCLHELVEAQVERRPDAVAVVYENTQLTYGELNAQANRLASYLRELGVGPDARVALCVERSLEMVVGLLAVLRRVAPTYRWIRAIRSSACGTCWR